ncbi:MAG: hypothetical protein J6P61_07105 [Erysipelotrichaceae bacterium]|nr:hypothetical protein [Erysipelotrichaceae bacterium]
MKKLMKFIVTLLMVLSVSGCQTIDVDEVEVRLKGHDCFALAGRVNTVYFICNYDADQKFIFYQDTEQMFYNDDNIEPSIMMDLSTKEFYEEFDDEIDITKATEDIEADVADQLMKSCQDNLKKWQVSLKGVIALSKERLAQKQSEYEKMSSHEKLKYIYIYDEDTIDKLSNDEADEFLKAAESIHGAGYLEDALLVAFEKRDGVSPDVKKVIDNMKADDKTITDSYWSLNNPRFGETDDTVGITLDLYVDGEDVNMTYMFLCQNNEFIGCHVKCQGAFLKEADKLLRCCGLVVSAIDPSISQGDDSVKVVAKSYESIYATDDWIYQFKFNKDGSITFMVARKS